MDIANQLIETFGKMDSTLNSLDDRMARLSESVDRFAEASNGAAEAAEKEEEVKDNQFKFEKKLAAFQKKRQKDQVAFARTVNTLAAGYKILSKLNTKRIANEKSTLKYLKEQNKITSKVVKTFSTLRDVAGLAAAKFRAMRDPKGGVDGEKSGGGGGNRFQKAKKAIMGGKLGALSAIIPGGFLITGASLLLKQLLKVDSTMAGLATQTGLVGTELQDVTTNVQKATAGLYAFGINMEDAGKNAAALVDKLGNASYVTEELVTNTSLIAKATGMSADEAATLTSTLIKGFGKTTPEVKEFADNMMSFATTSGVNARKVMRDISNDSNLTSIYLGRGEDALMRSAVLAAKMGKSMAEQNQTLDAFSTIEGAMETVAEINIRTGANLNAQKMFMLFQTQDIEGALRELQKAFSTPQAQANLDAFPGAFKAVASSLNMSVKDLRQLDKVMADFEKSSMGASKEQQEIEDHIKAGMDLLEQMKGIFFSAILPAFNSVGQMLVGEIKPTLNDATNLASALGKELKDAMDAENTFGGRLSAAFNVLIARAKPLFVEMGVLLGNAIMKGIETFFAQNPEYAMLLGAMMGGKAGAAFGVKGAGIGALVGGAAAGFGALMATDHSAGNGGGQGQTRRRNTRSRGVAMNAMGNVYNRPTLGLIGEENRTEVVIPTERIRKGLPINSSVAAELRSIGVPGFFAGGRGGGTGASAAALTEYGNTFALRQQERAVLSSQGDPEAIRRVEAKIEEQAARVRKDQRAIVNDIMEETLAIEKARYDGGAQSFGGGDGGGGDGGGGGGRGRSGFGRFEKGLHDLLTGLNNFMEVTGTGFKDIIPGLRNQLDNTDSFYNKLPEALQTGLTTGVQTAYDEFLATGKLTDAIKTGAIAGAADGFIKASDANIGTTKGLFQQLAGLGLQGAMGPGAPDLLSAENLRNALGNTLIAQQADDTSFLGKAFAADEAAIQEQQNAIFERENAVQIHEANIAEHEKAKKDRQQLFESHMEDLKKTDEQHELRASEREKAHSTSMALLAKMGADEAFLKNKQAEFLEAQIEAQQEYDKLRREVVHAQADEVTKANKAVDGAMEKVTGSTENFLKKKALDEKGPLGKLANKATTAFGDFGKSIKGLKGLKSGAMEGAITAFQQGGSVKDIAASAISGGVGKMAGTAITGALAPVLGPLAPFAGQFLGSKLGGFVGGAVGKLFGGKVIKPKAARAKITDAISQSMMGVTRPGMQLSKLFRQGTPKHKILKANIGIAAAKSPEKLYNRVGDIMYDASGIRFSTDRVATFTQALYKGDSGVIDSFEQEMETGLTRAGASGAIVNRPTVALIGEAGPEALVPLENAPGASPLNGVGGDNGELLQEIKRMNQMLGAMANRPITLDGQRVNAVLNTVNSDDIRAGIYTVNSR